jgi:starch synthase
MSNHSTNPRILIVTPEITCIPKDMGDQVSVYECKGRRHDLADVSATLINALYDQGADVHIALPDYHHIFNGHLRTAVEDSLHFFGRCLPNDRIHLARDKAFFHAGRICLCNGTDNIKFSLAFQREVMNNIVPMVQPDLIHCNDWMTGLIPAMARQSGIPCLFTFHNTHTQKTTLAEIEDRGIDAAFFWENLFFDYFPSSYENSRQSTPVDLLTSGVFAAHFVSTPSPTFLMEMVDGLHNFVKKSFQQEVSNKIKTGCAVGILNAPDPSYDPSKDEALVCTYSAADHQSGKKANKRALQKILNLNQDTQAPIFFWPSSLDPNQESCQLLSEILYKVIHNYREYKLQIVFIADGEFQRHFKDIIGFHKLSGRVAVRGFNERLARLAYGASDFILMPSRFEPCGLVQMIGMIYGALPVAHDTGGIHDTVSHLDTDGNSGNGFLFKTFDSNGLYETIDQAMKFYMQPVQVREQQIHRIMMQSASNFSQHVAAQRYIELYEKLLKRPLICKKAYARDESVKKHRMVTHPAQDHIDPTFILPFDDFYKHSDFEIYQKKGGPHGAADHQL